MQANDESKSIEARAYEELYRNGEACGRGFKCKNGAVLMKKSTFAKLPAGDKISTVPAAVKEQYGYEAFVAIPDPGHGGALRFWPVIFPERGSYDYSHAW